MTVAAQLTNRATWQAVVAELVGTFFLVLAPLLSGGLFGVALTLMVFVYAVGTISGGSLNPGVTIGLVVARHLSVTSGVLYIVAKVVGALVARFLTPLIAPLAPYYPAADPAGESSSASAS